MAVNGSSNTHTSGDDAPWEPNNRVVFRTGAVPSTQLRILTVVSQDGNGTSTAAVTLEGELCAFTVPQLRGELQQLADHGVTRVLVDLTGLKLCTSHGVDLFADVHAQLQQTSAGKLELHGPVGIVARVLNIVQHLDPAFTVRIQVDGPGDTTTSHEPLQRCDQTAADMAARIDRFVEDIDAHLMAASGEEE